MVQRASWLLPLLPSLAYNKTKGYFCWWLIIDLPVIRQLRISHYNFYALLTIILILLLKFLYLRLPVKKESHRLLQSPRSYDVIEHQSTPKCICIFMTAICVYNVRTSAVNRHVELIVIIVYATDELMTQINEKTTRHVLV